jgi:hypothetical protein
VLGALRLLKVGRLCHVIANPEARLEKREGGPAWLESLWSTTTRRCDTIFEASSNSKALGESVMKLPQEEKRYKG